MDFTQTQLTDNLQQWFGFSDFNHGQQDVIETLLQGQSALAIFPTGSGKSLCYQYSACCLPNLTLVVSPLLALMKDQLAFLADKGIAAASIDSTLSADDVNQVMQDARNGKLKVLMVSVERFKNERFRRFLSAIAISLLVVDEAHCISEWGHNFRPDYLKLPQYRQQFAIPQVLLLTATATRAVKQDMAKRFNIASNTIVQTGFERKNLSLCVQGVEQQNKIQVLMDTVKPLYLQDQAGIIYVTLQQTTETLAQALNQHGIHAKAYHAGLDYQIRQQIQDDFMSGHIKVVVATIAFGMGVDKSDIRFVIHYDLPKSIENYSQEIGRAGRDGKAAHCITLANKDGINTVENFVYADTPKPNDIAQLIEIIQQGTSQGRWEMQETPVSNQCNIRLLPLKTLLVQLEMRGVVTPSFAYFADFKYRFNSDAQTILSQFNQQRQQFLQQIFDFTVFKKVWGQLDFEALNQQFGHQRSRVVAALEYLAEKDLITLETKKITQVFEVNSQLLNQENLSHELSTYFANNEDKEIKRIAALVDTFESRYCLSFHLAQYFDDHQADAQCGRCSVCLGEAAQLPQSTLAPLASEQQLTQLLTPLFDVALTKGFTRPDVNQQAKFLVGMMMPRYSRAKIKQLPGFGACQQHRFAHVLEAVSRLTINL
ncbi:RecQ family ATP-dependent DNA helicase [Shewanella intestini]|uniref:ATP-dependent DNA helicase RecQ n=1 Tax=Shewanella intestini TaxID=2017544 RepID=A0ABS5HZH7_9GAMM|nr:MULTISPECIES: RecQ family ATP-dependent DNA helicase [Shewanella]MBR9727198.1 ATP-dependent DNA helicase RecQ [Shewanella intestini]MRG36000.1 RecQ family ATP-dependent DNA helicase [Shewanella sp. XMDDZSB0408]